MNINETELLNFMNGEQSLNSFTCEHCGTYCNLESSNSNLWTFIINKNSSGAVFKINCPKCNKESIYLAITFGQYLKRGFNGDVIFFNSEKINTLKQIYPKEKTIAKEFPEYVPNPLLNLYEEMCDLLIVNPKATIVWGRKWIEKFIITKWPEFNNSQCLANKIDKLSETNRIYDKEILDAIRKIGNDSVHIQSIEEDINITQEDASLCIALIEDLIVEYYIVPEERKQRIIKVKALKQEKETKAKLLKHK